MSKRICRGPHRVLQLTEETAMGGWVRCLFCGDTFHASAQALNGEYYHALCINPPGPDKDFFIHADIVDFWEKGRDQ